MNSPKVKLNFFIVLFFCLSIITVLVGSYIIKLQKINSVYYKQFDSHATVALRKFPYPYRAAMSISSDIDNTETLEELLEIQSFLHTKKKTSMGKGVGLEIGGSFFFFEPSSEAISFFSKDSEIARTIKKLIKAGYIDFMHSYGKKYNFAREDAINSLQKLKDDDLKLDVWVDHTSTIDNLGDDRTFGFGDHPDSNAYHADLTLNYGIKFAWMGRVTMVTGQSVPIDVSTYTSIFDSAHKINSIVNISKEFSKHILAILGHKKYALHKENDLAKISILNDGQKVYEFMRFDNYWRGVGSGANSKGLAYVISKATLKRLEKDGGYMIVYTHLGSNSDCLQYICIATQNALRNLAKEFEKGNIYVTTTSKLLNYYINHKYLNWEYKYNNDQLVILIHNVKDPVFGTFTPSYQNLSGITFYIPENIKVKIFIDKNEIENVERNSADFAGRESVTIPLSNLQFPL